MKKLLSIVFILLANPAFTQNRLSEHNNIAWFTTIITPKITDKLSGHIEYQWRRTDWVATWQQSLLRLGFSYKVHPQVTAQLGYAWTLTYPYGDNTIAAIPKTFPEHRIYEQLVINSPIGKIGLIHRLRVEQRWVGRLKNLASEKPDEWVMLNRVRYMPRLDVPLYKKLYAAAYDEILIGFGENVGENIFDQNRLGILLGYKFHPSVRAEAGYISQVLQLGRELANKNVYQYNNGLMVNTYLQLN